MRLGRMTFSWLANAIIKYIISLRKVSIAGISIIVGKIIYCFIVYYLAGTNIIVC
jgi:hypothetical protein